MSVLRNGCERANLFLAHSLCLLLPDSIQLSCAGKYNNVGTSAADT
jgi:hypothetical protein